MSILIFLVVLAILILVHEFGHFIVAKKSGVRVDEFGLGFPPRLFGVKKGETLYSLNAIPFGGFVKIFGENPDEESLHGSDSARSFVNKPKYIQAAILFAGVFFNILLAWLLISIGFMSGLPMPVGAEPEGTIVRNAQVTVTGVEDGSPAGVAGLMSGDRIISIYTENSALEEITISGVQLFISSNGNEVIELQYQRGSDSNTISVTPVDGIVEGKQAIGISMDTIGIVSLPPHRAIWEGGKLTVALTGAVAVAFWDLIKDLFTGNGSIKNLAGPVTIVGLVGTAYDFGFAYLLGFTAFISINLAVINLLPIPALDGGRLFFLFIEVIKGSPINPKYANMAHIAGFALLILLLLVVTYFDLVKLFVKLFS